MFGDSSDDDDDSRQPHQTQSDKQKQGEVRINKTFAARYNEQNRQQELLKAQHGKSSILGDESEESTSEEEDEDGQLLTSQLEATVAQTLAMIRSRDPKIYDPNFKVEYKLPNNNTDAGAKQKGDKPMFIKDYARYKHADELNSDDEGGDSKQKLDETQPHRLAYDQEQAELRRELKRAAAADAQASGSSNGTSADDTADGEGLFKVKRVIQSAVPAVSARDSAADRQPAHDDDNFLESYISQRKWAENAESDGFVPSYQEVIKEVDEYEKAEEYEKKYNFRYEEGGSSEIVGHSRKIEGSLRRTKDKRKKQREEKRKRKEEEKKRRAEELKRLKNLKRKQIAKKLSQIKELSGSQDVAAKLADHADAFDEDFDPAAHDKMMQKIFDEGYYSEDDEAEAADGEAAALPAKAQANPKLPEEVQKLLDEEFDLDYEDVVGGIATRFKYKKVEPNDYGLTAEEILNATDAELRQYVSTKKIQPHGEREWNVPSSKRRSFRRSLQSRIKAEKAQEVEELRQRQKAQHKRAKRKKQKQGTPSSSQKKQDKTIVDKTNDKRKKRSVLEDDEAGQANDEPKTKKPKKKKKKKSGAEAPEGSIPKSRLAAYGF